MLKVVESEHTQVKELQGLLRILKSAVSVDVPISVRRRDDFAITDIKLDDTFISNDPDVWPPPTPVDHGYEHFRLIYLILQYNLCTAMDQNLDFQM